MSALQVTGIVFGLFFAFILYCYIVGMIGNISNYFRAKRKREEMLVKKETDPNFPKPRLNYMEQIDATVSLLNLTNVLIDNEISRMIDTLTRLRTKYEIKKLDDDAKKIAESVFSSFVKEDTFLSSNMMLTDEYIMKHITEETITRLLNRTYEYNMSISNSSNLPN